MEGSAITSQLSAGINALASRSDLMVEATHEKLPRKYTYPGDDLRPAGVAG